MILLLGIPSESPMAMVKQQVERLGLEYVMFNQRDFQHTKVEYNVLAGRVTGKLDYKGTIYRLEDFSGVYTRLMDDQLLPELQNEPLDSGLRRHSRAVHDVLMRWCEIAPAKVVNRTGPMSSNYSKPYQLQLIREQGFGVPDTLITNDPSLATDFYRKHKEVIYKSISSVRSIVKRLQQKDLERLDSIRWCPVQFQQFIGGTNVRVHTIGDAAIATIAVTDATDYRYAQTQEGSAAELSAFNLPLELEKRCLNLSKSLGLEFAGIDLKITTNKIVYCLEVNPSPGFSYYEANTGQPIAETLARYLA